VRSRVFKIVYLAAITLATIGWFWMLAEGLTRALDIWQRLTASERDKLLLRKSVESLLDSIGFGSPGRKPE
jgi:hypothetical protein